LLRPGVTNLNGSTYGLTSADQSGFFSALNAKKKSGGYSDNPKRAKGIKGDTLAQNGDYSATILRLDAAKLRPVEDKEPL
jgi:hypothetical protein